MARGRGRLSSLQLLPRECSHVVQWAAAELQENARSQLDIYQEFVSKLEQIQREQHGEIEFTIPSYRSFNRYSVNLDELTRQITEAREMAAAIAGTFDAGESDDLTLVATEAIKSLVLTMVRTKKDSLDAKAVMALSSAVHKAAQAQSVSTDRRKKVEASFAEKAKEAVATVAKARGLTSDTTDAILSQILGVEKDQP